MKVLEWIDKRLAQLEGWLIILFLWFMVAFTFLQVCLRGLYTHGHLGWANDLMGHLEWSEPMVRLLVLWLTFLGASLLTREGRHIRIDPFSAFLPPKWARLKNLLLSLACVLISAIMLKVCMNYIALEMEFGSRIFLRLPSWIGQLILPIGFGAILFRFSNATVQQIVEWFVRAKK
jgi:TRAP-type C4-dicarboxylate transport system permease small subunit